VSAAPGTLGRGGVTARDVEVLRFCCEQYGLPLALAGRVAARLAPAPVADGSREVIARTIARRLEAGGYARRERIIGQVWLVPTRAGLALGQSPDQPAPYPLWQPHGFKLAHVAAVAGLRLALTARLPGVTWQPERAFRRRWAEAGRAAGVPARTRIVDGAVCWPDGRRVGVEVELHVKRPHLYAGIVADQDPELAGVWWYCPARSVDRLRRLLVEVGAGPGVEVLALPAGLGP
jgi:hypothetical protein